MSGVETRRCGTTPVRPGHSAHGFMDDQADDGVACESVGRLESGPATSNRRFYGAAFPRDSYTPAELARVLSRLPPRNRGCTSFARGLKWAQADGIASTRAFGGVKRSPFHWSGFLQVHHGCRIAPRSLFQATRFRVSRVGSS